MAEPQATCTATVNGGEVTITASVADFGPIKARSTVTRLTQWRDGAELSYTGYTTAEHIVGDQIVFTESVVGNSGDIIVVHLDQVRPSRSASCSYTVA